MSFIIKKYWKDSHETNQSGSLRNGVSGAKHIATGVGKGFMYYFLCKFRFLNHMDVLSILKLKQTLLSLLLRLGLGKDSLSPNSIAMLPWSPSNFSLNILSRKEVPTDRWKHKRKLRHSSLDSPLPSLDFFWHEVGSVDIFKLINTLSYLFPAYLGTFQSIRLSLIICLSLDPHNRLVT